MRKTFCISMNIVKHVVRHAVFLDKALERPHKWSCAPWEVGLQFLLDCVVLLLIINQYISTQAIQFLQKCHRFSYKNAMVSSQSYKLSAHGCPSRFLVFSCTACKLTSNIASSDSLKWPAIPKHPALNTFWGLPTQWPFVKGYASKFLFNFHFIRESYLTVLDLF